MLLQSEEVESSEEDELSISYSFPMKYIFWRFRIRKIDGLIEKSNVNELKWC
jgi:hypothetical protein